MGIYESGKIEVRPISPTTESDIKKIRTFASSDESILEIDLETLGDGYYGKTQRFETHKPGKVTITVTIYMGADEHPVTHTLDVEVVEPELYFEEGQYLRMDKYFAGRRLNVYLKPAYVSFAHLTVKEEAPPARADGKGNYQTIKGCFEALTELTPLPTKYLYYPDTFQEWTVGTRNSKGWFIPAHNCNRTYYALIGGIESGSVPFQNGSITWKIPWKYTRRKSGKAQNNWIEFEKISYGCELWLKGMNKLDLYLHCQNAIAEKTLSR